MRGSGVMSAQELVACLCREGDQHLALGEPPLATAFYLAAFSCHGPSAVRRVRAALAEARGAPVVATLEAWCRGDGQIPAIHWDGMAVVSLTGAQASAFLATLCPDHPAAALHSLAGLLAHGRHSEVVRRCCALLDAHSHQSLELRLTRALARVLSGAQAADGVADYLQAFASSAQRAVAFIRTHQQPYLPALVRAVRDYSLGPGEPGAGTRVGECQALLTALAPEGTWSDDPAPTALLQAGRYEACQAACSRALDAHPAGGTPQGERLAMLLVTRAAAAFFLESGVHDVLRDLHEAFRQCPSGAQRQLQAMISAGDLERLRARVQEAADSGFAGFQEVVRRRPELREDSGRELLAPVNQALRVLLHVAPPGAQPALGSRLAECLLLGGKAAAAQALCESLLQPACPTSQGGDDAGSRTSLLALHGFCALHAGDMQRAQEDFQEVVERGPPHANSCVRALCGRGLLRVLAGSAFLGTLDYVTACRLHPEDTLLVTKAYVPWNQRGLLLTVLREEGRRMLQRGAPGPWSKGAQRDQPTAQEGDARGVYQLATLLLGLDEEDEASCLLAADALYLLGRLADAHKTLLVALARRPRAVPVLVRLALLQLGRGFCYDADQLLKKVVQSGDTACLAPTLDIFCPEDRQLLHGHCHSRALAILRARPAGPESGAHTREAIAYLSLAIFAAGSQASDSLLARAHCYGLLGRKKTALFDLDRLLQAQPGHVPALCGRALLRLALDQRKAAADDLLAALQLDARAALAGIRALTPAAQALVARGLGSRCRADLDQRLDAGARLGPEDARRLRAAGEALVRLGAGRPGPLLLLADVLAAAGRFEEARARLREALGRGPASEAALARRGLLRLKAGDARAAARDLQGLAEADPRDLGFLLRLLEPAERRGLAQVAAQEAAALLKASRPGQALGYCSLAVLAGGGIAHHLRLRAACLAELQQLERALGDLDRVLREAAGDTGAPERAEDLCSQGRLLLRLGDEAGAARAFAQALQLAPGPAQGSLWERPGRAPTARVLLCHGQRCLEEGRLAEAWGLAQSGLLADPQHHGLKRLKARIRRAASPGCRLH